MGNLLEFSFEVTWNSATKRILVFNASVIPSFILKRDEQLPSITGFNLLYSEYNDPTSFIKINPEILDTATFTHILANYSQAPTGYYKIEALMSTGNSELSRVFDIFSFSPSLQEREYQKIYIRRSMFNLFTGPGNIPVAFYPRRVSGIKCECAPAGQGSYAFNCSKCLSTGFIGGYHGPLLGFIEFQSMDGKQKDNGKILISENNSNGIRTCARFVLLRSYDIIKELRPPFTAYEVTQVQVSRFNSMPVDINAGIKQLDSGHPINKLPLVFPKYLPNNTQYRKRTVEGDIINFEDEYDKMASSLEKRA